MLKIRLTRMGKKNRPYYRIVVAEHSMPIKGRFIEICGSYDPIKKKLVLKKEEIMKWLNNGAKPSNTVAKLLLKEGMKHKSIVFIEFHKKKKSKGDKKKRTVSTSEVVMEKQESPQKLEINESEKIDKKEKSIKENLPDVKVEKK